MTNLHNDDTEYKITDENNTVVARYDESADEWRVKSTAFVTDLLDDASGNVVYDSSAEELTADVNNSSVSTDDIPFESWEQWARRNGVRSANLGGRLDYTTSGGLGTSTSGSAGVNQNNGRVEMRTGTTSGSVAKVFDQRQQDGYGTQEFSTPTWDKRWLLHAPIGASGGNVSDRIDYYAIRDDWNPDSAAAGFGVKVANGDILGFVHDGSSETTTTLISGASSLQHIYFVDYDGPDGTVTWCVDGVEEGTVSNGLPSGEFPTGGTAYCLGASVENTAAVARGLELNEWRWGMIA